MVMGLSTSALAAAGRQLQGLADQGQGDFRLPCQFAADEPFGDFRRQVDAGRFPLGQPGLLGLMDIEDRLSQGGDDRGKLPLDHLVDFGQRRLAAFGLGLGADGCGLLLGLTTILAASRRTWSRYFFAWPAMSSKLNATPAVAMFWSVARRMVGMGSILRIRNSQ